MTGSDGRSRYSTPEAMLSALTEFLRRESSRRGARHNDLRRQLAYDRLLARVFVRGAEDWTLKGGTALLARVRDARHTRDIDLAHRSGDIQTAVSELRSLMARDMGDHFRFEIGRVTSSTQRPGQPGTSQAKLHLEAFVGATSFESFSVDVVVGTILTSEPERFTPTLVVEFDGLVPPTYLLYPVADHVADKLCATVERHSATGKSSTRFRDLVDLVVIARTQTVRADDLWRAIEAERLSRGLAPIQAFAAPSEWQRSYPPAARKVSECRDYTTLEQAEVFVRRFLDPVLSGVQRQGTWLPGELSWR